MIDSKYIPEITEELNIVDGYTNHIRLCSALNLDKSACVDMIYRVLGVAAGALIEPMPDGLYGIKLNEKQAYDVVSKFNPLLGEVLETAFKCKVPPDQSRVITKADWFGLIDIVLRSDDPAEPLKMWIGLLYDQNEEMKTRYDAVLSREYDGIVKGEGKK